MKVLDLFAGLGGWSAVARARGHDVRTLDFDPKFECDYVADILEWDPATLPWRPDLVLASPPCEGFTVMNIGKNWTRPDDDPPHQPKTDSARLALRIVERTREIIEELAPSFFIIENPRAKLRVLPVVADLERRTAWYCHLGETMAKPTDLFGGFPPSLVLPEECHNAREDHPPTCCCRDHASAPRGSRTPGSIQGVRGKDAWEVAALRAKVPERLALLVCTAAEQDLAEGRAAVDPEPDQPTLWGAIA